jgi:methylthioribose-1-phosphate isomerase
MKVHGTPTRTIWPVAGADAVEIIDQTALPHSYRVLRLNSLDDVAQAIRSMQVRGAPLIGVSAAYGIALALSRRADDATLLAALQTLAATRPTAVNLHWALARVQACLLPLPAAARAAAAWLEAGRIADEDVDQCRRIGAHGLQRLLSCRRAGHRLEIMTHCNAGWLATVDHGTALAPVYAAFDAGIDSHVWVSETRPRNQGLLTAWELRQHGVPHTRHRRQRCRPAAGARHDRRGDRRRRSHRRQRRRREQGRHLAQGAGGAGSRRTVLRRCAALDDRLRLCERRRHPDRGARRDELRLVHGLDGAGHPGALRQLPADEAVANPAFDVTPASLVSALISERGACAASREGLLTLYPGGASMAELRQQLIERHAAWRSPD